MFDLCAMCGPQIVTCEMIGTYAIRSAMRPNMTVVYVAVDFWRLRCTVSCSKSTSAALKQHMLKLWIERVKWSVILSYSETVDRETPSGFFLHLLCGVCLEM